MLDLCVVDSINMGKDILNQGWTAVEIKEKINTIKDHLFPSFFLLLETLGKEIVQYIPTPIVESAMNTANDIHNHCERLFFKEKLILLPYLIKVINEGQSNQGGKTIGLVIEETKKIQQMITSFKSNFSQLSKKMNKEEDADKVLPTIEALEELWQVLANEKYIVFNSFTKG